MTRTSDEIKKGLECCSKPAHEGPCQECPYAPNNGYCAEIKSSDALALIQQLQAENAQQARCIENMTDKLNAMNDEVAKLQAERDAAVKDMTVAVMNVCDVCKSNELIIDEAPCKECMHIFKGRYSKFEWRGVTKEVCP